MDNNSKINAIILGYLTRKFKRNIPINSNCNCCNKDIKGKIHRQEFINNNKALIMYKSIDGNDKGLSSFSYTPISVAFVDNSLYYCINCFNKNGDLTKCCICLNQINKEIITECNHKFCNKCLINWIKHDNKSKNLFNATCPLCRSRI